MTYGYNVADEVTTLTEPGSPAPQTSFAYDPNHRRTTTTYPDGVTMTFSYDNAERTSTVTATNATTTLVNLTYSFLNGGKDTLLITTITENDAPGVGPYPIRQFTTTQSYDPRNHKNHQCSW